MNRRKLFQFLGFGAAAVATTVPNVVSAEPSEEIWRDRYNRLSTAWVRDFQYRHDNPGKEIIYSHILQNMRVARLNGLEVFSIVPDLSDERMTKATARGGDDQTLFGDRQSLFVC